MNWGLLFSIVNFAALVFILRKLLRKPLAKFLKNRSDLVANRLAEIKTVKLNADRRHRDSEWRFAKIDKEIEEDISKNKVNTYFFFFFVFLYFNQLKKNSYEFSVSNLSNFFFLS